MNYPYAESYSCATPECDFILSECNQKSHRKIFCTQCIKNRKYQRWKEKHPYIPKLKGKTKMELKNVC